MDGFNSVVFLWIASALLVTTVGYFRGQADDALTLGVLLGPVALGVMVVAIMRGRLPLNESPSILKIADHARRPAAPAETRLRRPA